jgi:integrase
MPRPRKDGTATAPPRKRKLTELTVRKAKPEPSPYNIWDEQQRGLVLRVQPTGHAAFKVVYTARGRVRWLHIGAADAVGLADARRIAAEAMLQVIKGGDPAADRQAERGAGTFEELAERYLDRAKSKNKSWRQADKLVRRYLLPRWAKLQAKSITRADVRAVVGRISAPVLRNQVLAHASAVFAWGVKEEIIAANPCRGVDRAEVRSRERILSDGEIPLFWSAFDSAGLVASSALKVILLTGQRPGEVSCMRREHLKDGWWELPGAPVPEIWPGTKNGQSHRVWLPQLVTAILTELTDAGDKTAGFVFAGPRGRPVRKLADAMRRICAHLQIDDKVTPHDLRRTFSSKVTGLGFGRDAMNRVTNHKEGGISSVYDRHQYADENKRIMEITAAHIMTLALGSAETNVVQFRKD